MLKRYCIRTVKETKGRPPFIVLLGTRYTSDTLVGLNGVKVLINLEQTVCEQIVTVYLLDENGKSTKLGKLTVYENTKRKTPNKDKHNIDRLKTLRLMQYFFDIVNMV